MKLALKVGRLLLINFLVVIGLILVTMIPRETNQVELNEFNVKYIFSIQAYFTNLLDYVKERFTTLNLGETWDRTSVFQETIFYFSNSLQLIAVSLILAFVIGIALSYLIRITTRNSKILNWLKVPNFLLMIPLVYSISLIGAMKSIFFLSLLISLYPSFYIASLLKEKSTLLKEKVSFIFTKFSKVFLLLLSNLVLVEWLTEYKGAGYKLVTLIDFSTEPFTRANRSYEYELVITLLLCFICTVLLAQWIEFLVKKYVKEIETHWGWYVFSHSLIILGTVILILIPRGATQDYTDIVYIFSMDTYKDNLKQLVNGMIYEQTLGKTKSGFIVEEEIANYFPRSLKIILFAFLVSIVVGVAKGIFDFKYQNRWFSFMGRGTTWLTSSFPDFFLIILLQWFVIVNFQSIDIMGYEEWYNFIIPSLLISIHPIMYVATITRGSFIEENGEQYVLVAYSKGLTKNTVIIRHILKNAIPAICNHLPSVILYIMSNLLIIEWLLDYKGAAYRLFKAIEFSKSIPLQGGLATEEAPLIFGILLCFMIPLVLAQVISVVTKYKFNKVGRE